MGRQNTNRNRALKHPIIRNQYEYADKKLAPTYMYVKNLMFSDRRYVHREIEWKRGSGEQ